MMQTTDEVKFNKKLEGQASESYGQKLRKHSTSAWRRITDHPDAGPTGSALLS